MMRQNLQAMNQEYCGVVHLLGLYKDSGKVNGNFREFVDSRRVAWGVE